MHLLVLSAFRHIAERVVCHVPSGFNAPSGAQCFPTYKQGNYRRCEARVSMHLLVLSAFRPEEGAFVHLDIPVSMHLLVLSAFQLAPLGWMSVGLRSFNAPSGAQCFPTDGDDGASQESAVSMHLLVLSAFQPLRQPSAVARYGLFQCTFWCSVLSNFSKGGENVEHVARFNAPSGAQCFPTRQPASGKNKMIPEFQCTFWCSVLSNGVPSA